MTRPDPRTLSPAAVSGILHRARLPRAVYDMARPRVCVESGYEVRNPYDYADPPCVHVYYVRSEALRALPEEEQRQEVQNAQARYRVTLEGRGYVVQPYPGTRVDCLEVALPDPPAPGPWTPVVLRGGKAADR